MLKVDPSKPLADENCMFLAGPSNSTIVSHWLIRQPPFTQMHMDIEDGKFGYATRLFQSLDRAVIQVLYGQICWEYVPEIYCQPELFVNFNGYVMGEGMGDCLSLRAAVDFVYLHRKALESRFVSERLSDWIDLVFGNKTGSLEQFNMYAPTLHETVWEDPKHIAQEELVLDILKTAGQLPSQLFHSLHPRRAELAAETIVLSEEFSVAFENVKSVALEPVYRSCVCSTCEDGVLGLIGVSDDGEVSNCQVEFNTGNCIRTVVTAAKWPNCLFVPFWHGFVLVQKHKGLALSVGLQGTTDIEFPVKPVAITASGRDVILVGNECGKFVWWFTNEHTLNEISFVQETVVCVAVSQWSGIVAFGTTSGFVFISDLESHQVSFRCDLEGRLPIQILISDEFGFIFVSCDDYSLRLFNVNGAFIRKVPFGREIVAWKSFRGVDGFDYLVVCDTRGKLRACELFYLNFTKPFCRVDGRIQTIDYDPSTRTLIAVSDRACAVWSVTYKT
jgi:hypothetical protein